MKIKRFRQRLLSLLCLVLILVPMLALSVFASSERYNYSFTFNGEGGTQSVTGKKTDVGDTDSQDYAGVSITGGYFGDGGSVRYYVEDSFHNQVTKVSRSYNSLNPSILLEYRYTFKDVCDMTLYCTATYGVMGVGGKFQP